jgi:hypothetical protein
MRKATVEKSSCGEEQLWAGTAVERCLDDVSLPTHKMIT